MTEAGLFRTVYYRIIRTAWVLFSVFQHEQKLKVFTAVFIIGIGATSAGSSCLPCHSLLQPDTRTVSPFPDSDSPYTDYFLQLPPLWKTLETAHFIISYEESHKIFAQKVAELAESIYDDGVTFMRCTPREKTDIYIFPSTTRFFSWESSFADRAYASPENRGIMLIYGCPFSTEVCGWNYLDLREALSHEFNHVLFYWTIDNDYYVDKLRDSHQWIMEGIATYCEQYPFTGPEYDDLLLPVVVEYLEENDTFPVFLEEITLDEYQRLMYPLAYSVIQFMIDQYGKDAFHLFLNRLKEYDISKTPTQNVDEALQLAFGTPKEQFEKEWTSYVKETYTRREDGKWGAVQLTQPPGWKVPSHWCGNKILFISDTTQNLDIFTMNADGTGIQQVTVNESCDFDARFSPDGKKIAFTSLRNGYAHIYCMRADGTEVTQLTFGKYMDFMGSWSPDGQKIAFTSGRRGNYDIYTMNADGSLKICITYYKGDDGWPVFSPDGGKILFVSDRNGTYDLYIMNADGTEVEQLCNTPEYENFPQFSPDGKKIVFLSRWETGAELCIMNSDGSERKQLVTPPVVIVDTMARHRQRILGYPVWSPDGEEIAFVAVNQVFTVSVGGYDIWWIVAGITSVFCVFLWVWRKRAKGVAVKAEKE